MNIGVFNYRQSPYISANTAIGYEIGLGLKNIFCHNVFFVGMKQDKEQDESYENITINYLNNKLNFDSNRFANKIYSCIGEEKKYVREARKLKKFVQEKNIDILIVFFAPIQTLLITKKAKLNIPIVLYQLDPYYNLNMVVDKKKKQEFIRFVKDSKFLFTTEELFRDYKNDKEIKPYLQKIIPVGFPKVKPIEKQCVNNDDIVMASYIGSLYKKIRSPQILLNLSELLPENCILTFLGSADTDLSEIQNNEKIDYKGYCTQEVSLNTMRNSKYLVNIGNTVTNQLGSKLIDYISTGKPIINIYQTENCPTLRVLERYPCKLNIYSKDIMENYDEVRVKLNEFISNNLDFSVPFEEITNLYCEYTPEYICEKLNDIL